ncbi:hypothetical protein MPL3356_350058 [Mesorhizobium plurifarium]|uniref:Uncharacterized protein n=1 Tax=Mesorhizobium plurifarium TaxID=69974 RepID=A0A090E3F1_MESPL|nr:hypothetical protein MPL3356_350058 [Mesorhizobium plurifarium]
MLKLMFAKESLSLRRGGRLEVSGSWGVKPPVGNCFLMGRVSQPHQMGNVLLLRRMKLLQKHQSVVGRVAALRQLFD